MKVAVAAMVVSSCFAQACYLGNASTTGVGPGAPVTNGDASPNGDAGLDPYGTPVKCSSGSTWSGGEGSPEMHPGLACIACHARGEGPRFAVAGTVFPTAHEPDDCYGASSSVTVVITDSAGKVLDLTTNGAGNFSYRGTLSLPYTAKVAVNGQERAMGTAQTTGDCNSCHTVTGANGAPGRIMAP